MSLPTLAALIVAAGRGTRLGADLPKAFVPLGGLPLFHHSLATFASLPNLSQLVLVVADERRADAARLLAAAAPLPVAVEIVAGGAERQDSVAAGLAHVRDAELVAVHDAARPFVRGEQIAACVEAAAATGAALLALPAHDTIKIAAADGCVATTPDRRTIWQAQTPQIFRRELLRAAYAQAAAENFIGTDDAQLVERTGARVRLVVGDLSNRKVTTADDLLWAEWQLARAAAPVAAPRPN